MSTGCIPRKDEKWRKAIRPEQRSYYVGTREGCGDRGGGKREKYRMAERGEIGRLTKRSIVRGTKSKLKSREKRVRGRGLEKKGAGPGSEYMRQKPLFNLLRKNWESQLGKGRGWDRKSRHRKSRVSHSLLAFFW